ncbi:hypothetical protein OG568_60805 (plasmid) [Streptomyces sp. NBC_01450]|uniref:hypothetical protein n=1 Tax=Streptomyces sp. NBC_01450 TaxID=2903871 RepID=UPI002E363075|nr:hypothetical protein [Streptomyces sp. NBC_01450]
MLTFPHLTVVPDGDDVVVGRADTGVYAVFPADGAALLGRLQAGASTDEAAGWYRERYGESADMMDFLSTLRMLGFVHVSGEPSVTAPPGAPRGQLLGRLAFSWPAWLVYAGLCGYALYLLVRFPGLRPSPNDLFFTQSLLLTELGLLAAQVLGGLHHEVWHALAGRRLGVRTRLRLGNRLYFLVFETDLTELWSLPRRYRYLPLLAGMVGDLVWFSLATILARTADTYGGPHGFPGTFLRALALSALLRLAWQFQVHLRTDVYQVLVTALRCVDLRGTTRESLVNRVRRLLRRAAPYVEERWYPRDRQVARWYVFLAGAGYVVTLGMGGWIGVPFLAHMFTGVTAQLRGEKNALDAAPFPNASFVDGCLTLLINLAPMATVVFIVLFRRRAHRTAAGEQAPDRPPRRNRRYLPAMSPAERNEE